MNETVEVDEDDQTRRHLGQLMGVGEQQQKAPHYRADSFQPQPLPRANQGLSSRKSIEIL